MVYHTLNKDDEVRTVSIFTRRVGIDLGSARTRIVVPRRGVVVDEPSVVARQKRTRKVIAVGNEALEMIGRTPETVIAFYPLENGVIADFGSAEKMVRALLQKAIGRWQIRKPEAMITVSLSATSAERKAVVDVGREAGLQHVYLLDAPVAAALGAELPITEPRGHMLLDIGSGTTEVAVFSLGGVVSRESVRLAGKSFDEAVVRYLRREHRVVIGQPTAEEIKQKLGQLDVRGRAKTMTVHGRSLIEALPKKVKLSSQEVTDAIEPAFERILLIVRRALEHTPPDLVSDIAQTGVIITGGSSRLKGLNRYLTKKLKARFFVATDPIHAAARGTGVALQHLEAYKRSLLGD